MSDYYRNVLHVLRPDGTAEDYRYEDAERMIKTMMKTMNDFGIIDVIALMAGFRLVRTDGVYNVTQEDAETETREGLLEKMIE